MMNPVNENHARRMGNAARHVQPGSHGALRCGKRDLLRIQRMPFQPHEKAGSVGIEKLNQKNIAAQLIAKQSRFPRPAEESTAARSRVNLKALRTGGIRFRTRPAMNVASITKRARETQVAQALLPVRFCDCRSDIGPPVRLTNQHSARSACATWWLWDRRLISAPYSLAGRTPGT